MRIFDSESDKKLDTVMLFLTKVELQQLIGYAKQLLETPSSDHHHLSSEDYQKEIVLCVYDPQNVEKFSSRIQSLIHKDK